jgi:alkaline phosphatase
LKRLKKHKTGFFLMVEGGLIDVAHHKNNAKRALEETLEFERAIKVGSGGNPIKQPFLTRSRFHQHVYAQLLRAQIPKAQKRQSSHQ